MMTQSRTLTQDGYLWLIARKAMTDTALIRERMAKDIETLSRSLSPSTHIKLRLIEIGWTQEQVFLHSPALLEPQNKAGSPA